jgi:DNA-binding winged helix-turn-helix (wHTH) protein/TolB-like protein/Flp pilus assembly protein TadD
MKAVGCATPMDDNLPAVYVFEGFRLDRARRRVVGADGQVLPLPARAYDVLVYLVENRTRVVTKDELMRAVWSRAVVEENNLNQAIRNLRKALGDSRETPRFVVTVAGRGFQFVAATRTETGEPGPVVSTPPPPEPPLPTDATPTAEPDLSMAEPLRSRRWLLLAGVAAAATGVGGIAWWRHAERNRPGLPQSIAVLPFNPLLEQQGNAAIELGITESLINQLGTLPEVVVLPLSSVRRFSGTATDPLQAARELDVAAVLDGHVQIDRNRLRVTARLLDAGTGRALWSGRFNENLNDFFVVQESLAHQLARALTMELSPEQRVRLARRATADPEAWQLYLNGRYQFGLRTVDGLRQALAYYEAAAQRDPTFAPPHAGIADVLAMQGAFGLRPPQSVLPRAESEARRSIELDQDLADGHMSLGHVTMQLHRNWREGERLYRHALALRPDQARGRLLLSICLLIQGRAEEALAEARWSQSIEPADVTFAANFGMVLTYTRQLDQAYEQLSRLFGSAPNSLLLRHYLARVHVLRGEPGKAISLLEGYEGRVPGSFSNLGRAYAAAGRATDARAELVRLRALGQEGFGVGVDMALIHAGLGERDESLSALETGVADLSQMMLFLNVEPGFDSLRDEPRFRAVVHRLGLG